MDNSGSLQSMPGEYLRSQLTNMSQALENAMLVLQPNLHQRDELRTHIVQCYHQTAEQNHMRILERWKIIEEHKEEIENQNLAKVIKGFLSKVSPQLCWNYDITNVYIP